MPSVTSPQSLLGHLKVMMGPFGLYQHARQTTPFLPEGYCTDDNARAVQVLLHLRGILPSEARHDINGLIDQCWQFLCEAQESSGIYFNFRTAEGEWLSPGRSADMYARLLRAIVHVIIYDDSPKRIEQATTMVPALLTTIRTLDAPRAWAEVLVALAALPLKLQEQYDIPTLLQHEVQLIRELWASNSSPDWPWFESTMTYANALFPHGLLAQLKINSSLEKIVRDSTQFLVATTIRNGVFIPIGSRGWYPKGGTPSHDNQQPIEAGTMIDFFMDYLEFFADDFSPEIIAAPYLWFFGKNTHTIIMVDTTTGACLDGLFREGPNRNCGAESLLAYLWAEVRLSQAPLSVREYAVQQRQALLARLS